MPFGLDMRFWATILSPFSYVYRKLLAALRWVSTSLRFIPDEEARVPLLDSDDGSVYSDALDGSYTDDDNDDASLASVSDAGTIRPNAHHHVDVGYSISADSSFASFDSAGSGSREVGCRNVGGPGSTDEEDYVYLDDGAPYGLWDL